MSIFDSLLSDLVGSEGASPSPMANVLTGLLGGQAGAPGLQGMLGGAAGSGMAGSLPGLVAQFEQAGLGHIVQSWIGQGPNHPVSPDQLHSALGEDQVQGMANQAGMEPNAFLTLLAQHLPNAVHAMTPDGRVPETDSV